MSNIKKNLEIILDIKDIEKRIKDLENKAIIEGKTGLATQASAIGSDVAGGIGSGGIGGSSGSGGPNVGEAGSTVKTGEDVFDNLDIGDKLDQLKDLYDCATGDEITLSPSGQFVPPEGQTSANENYDGWTQGYYYTVSGAYFTNTQVAAAEQAPYLAIGYHSVAFGYDVTAVRNITLSFNGSGDIIGGNYEVYLDWPSTGDGWASTSFLATKISCGSESGTTKCPTSNPQKQWPTGGPTQMVWKDGRWQTNSNQTDAAAKYADGMQSQVDFCFDDSNGDTRHGSFMGSNDGGSIAVETNELGEPISDGLHFTPDGVFDHSVNKNEINKFKA